MSCLKRTMLCAALMGLPCVGTAQNLDLNVTGGSDELRSELKDAMSIYALVDSGEATPQGLIAAAQADYGRIVAALYGGGGFRPLCRSRWTGAKQRVFHRLKRRSPSRRS